MPSVRFTLPFIRADVFTELCRFGRPLGVYGRDVQFQAQKGSNIAADDMVYVGCQRAAYFSQDSQTGFTVSECVEVIPHVRLVWRELQCRKKGLQYIKGMETQPEVCIELSDDLRGGTVVDFRMDFERVAKDSSGAVDPTLEKRFRQHVADLWHNDMWHRGYVPLPSYDDLGA